MFKGDSNPLYDVYIVEADKPENVTAVAKSISKIDGVGRADYGGTNTKNFGLSKVIRQGLGAQLLCLSLSS